MICGSLACTLPNYSAHAIKPWLDAKLPCEPVRDCTQNTLAARIPNALVINADTAAGPSRWPPS